MTDSQQSLITQTLDGAPARGLLVLLALETTESLTSLASLRNARHTFRVISLGLLARPKDLSLGQETIAPVSVARNGRALLALARVRRGVRRTRRRGTVGG